MNPHFATLILLAWTLPLLSSDASDGLPDTLIVSPEQELELKVAQSGALVEAAWNGGVLSPVDPILRAPSSGDHWLAIASRDWAGNSSELRWVQIRVDDEPPTLSLTIDPEPIDPEPIDGGNGPLWVPPGALAVAEAHDALAGLLRLEIQAGDDTPSTTEDSLHHVLPSAEGEIRPVAVAVDRVGHRSIRALALSVDATAPHGTFAVLGPELSPQAAGDPHILAPSSRVEASLWDDGSGLADWRLKINDREADKARLEGPWTPGEHRIEILASDRVGNVGQIGPWRILVDAAGPEISWRVQDEGVINDAGQQVYRPPIQVEISAEDHPAGPRGLEASTDDGKTFQPVDGPLAIDLERLHLRAIDRVGNTTTETASWRLDDEAPVIRLHRADGTLVEGQIQILVGDTLHPEVVDDGAGLREAHHRFVRDFPHGLVDTESRPLPTVFDFPAAGSWRLIIHAIDRLGQSSNRQWDLKVKKGKD